jgi:hypothetical protein
VPPTLGSLPRCPRQPPAAAAMDDPLWLPTEEVCRRLAISRTTLFQLRRQPGPAQGWPPCGGQEPRLSPLPPPLAPPALRAGAREAAVRRHPCQADGPAPKTCPETGGPADWLDTPALCSALAISRSTLGRWRRRGLLISGHHWVRKNPACPRSDLLWHQERCSASVALANNKLAFILQRRAEQ